ncbi:MAG: solute:sodium symporter family transporter [Verrucomicrobiota bacterium]
MLTVISFLFFTGLVGYISYQYTRKDDHASSTGYFLAGRSLPWIVVGGSLLLTNLSTEQLVGLNSGGYQHGMQVMAWEVWSAMAMVVMALVFLPRYLKGGVTTVSQFLERRYDATVGKIISILLLLSLLTNLLPFVLYSGAIFMERVFGVSELFGDHETAALWGTVIALGVVGSIYAIYGGLKAVAVSDTLNGIGLFFGGMIVPILALVKLGDGSFFDGIATLTSVHPEKMDSIGKPGENIPASTLFTGMTLITIYYWCTNQAIVQRTFASKSLEQGQKGVLFAAGLKLLGPVYLIVPGIVAFHLYADQLVDKPDDAYAMIVQDVLPAPLLGFFGAVIFGAILSSFNSGLNSAATLFSVDLYKGWFRPNASEEDTVRVGKKFGIIIAAGAILVAPLIAHAQGGLFDLMKKLAALYNIPLLAITLIGIFTKKIPAIAAKVALITGFVFYAYFGLIKNNMVFGVEMHWLHVAGLNGLVIAVLMFIIGLIMPRVDMDERAEYDYTNLVSKRFYPLLKFGVTIVFVIQAALCRVAGLTWMQVGLVSAMLGAAMLIFFSTLKPPEVWKIQRHTRDVDIEPWKHARTAGVSVIILVALIYAAFHMIATP